MFSSFLVFILNIAHRLKTEKPYKIAATYHLAMFS